MIDLKEYYLAINKLANEKELSNKEKEIIIAINKQSVDYLINRYIKDYNIKKRENFENLSEIIEIQGGIDNVIADNYTKRYYKTIDDNVWGMAEYFKGKFKGEIRYVPSHIIGGGVMGRAFIGTGLIEILDTLYGREKASTIVHEIIHMLYPDKDEAEVRLIEYILCGDSTKQDSRIN